MAPRLRRIRRSIRRAALVACVGHVLGLKVSISVYESSSNSLSCTVPLEFIGNFTLLSPDTRRVTHPWHTSSTY